MIITIRDQSGRHLLLESELFLGTGIVPVPNETGAITHYDAMVHEPGGALFLGAFASKCDASAALSTVHVAVSSKLTHCDPCGADARSALVVWRDNSGLEYEWDGGARSLRERINTIDRVVAFIDTSKGVSMNEVVGRGGHPVARQ